MRRRLWALTLAVALVGLFIPSGAVALSWGGATNVSSHGGSYALISCPAASSCTVVNGGWAYSFDPDDLDAVTTQVLPAVPGFAGFACPAVEECVLAATNGEMLTFNPSDTDDLITRQLSITPKAIGCASTSQCTVVGAVSGESSDPGADDGEGLNFDPTDPNQAPGGSAQDLSFVPDTIACPTVTQCTVGGLQGSLETFDPQGFIEDSSGFLPADYVGGLACPSAAQCTVVGNSGDAYSFDPTDIDDDSPAQTVGQELQAVGCASVSDCVAAAGDSLAEGDPETPTAPFSPDPTSGLDAPITSISCPAANVCVAVDENGNVISAPPPSSTAPLTTTAPTDPSGAQTGDGDPPGPLGRATVGDVAATSDGLRATLRCRGASDVRCTFILTLSAGVEGSAAARTVTLTRESRTVRLVLAARARRLLVRDRSLHGRLVVSQQLYGGTIVLAVRNLAFRAVSR